MSAKKKAISDDYAVKSNGSSQEGFQWEFTVGTRAAARRFESVIQACVFCAPPTALQVHELSGLLAARLICLDGLRPDALPLLMDSASVPYRCAEHIAIEWREGAHLRTERRFLNPLTLHVWPRRPELRLVQDVQELPKGSLIDVASHADEVKNPPFIHREIGDLTQPLICWLHANGLYAGERDPLRTLASDQLAWLCQYLPGPLVSHCAGVFVLTALDRTVWGRHETRLALSHEPRSEETEELPEFQTDTLLEALGNVSGTTFNENLLKAALEVLQTSHGSRIDGLTKRLWIEGLLKLPLSLNGNSPISVVLVGWIAYMCEFGTVSSSNPAASTIRQYASAVLLHLGKGLCDIGEEPDTWDVIDLDAVYSDIYKAKSTGTRAATAAAIRSFQSYLEEVFDTEHAALGFLTSSRKTDDNAAGLVAPSGSRVKANVLWPHEIDWCQSACASALDPRVGQIAKVMFSIARECAVRYQDLSRLVSANLSFGGDVLGPYCQIEVVRRARRGRLKTDASQRRLVIRQSAALCILRDWVEVRGQETGNLSAYFFGDKSADNERYRPAAVQAQLNKLVKLASGYAHARFHDLRHTVVSQQVEETLKSCSSVDINPLYALASVAGHVLPITTLRSYSHFYESALRLWIDFGLNTALRTRSDDQARVLRLVSGKKTPLHGNSLIQEARRRGCDYTHHWLRQLEATCEMWPLPRAADPFQWKMPAPMTPAARGTRKVSVLAIADALGRLQNGATHEQLARLAGIPLPIFEELIHQLDAWTARLYRRLFPRITRDLASLPPLVGRLQRMRVDTGACGLSFWSEFAATLDNKVSNNVMTSAVNCWEEHGRGLYFPLVPNTQGRPLLQLLRYAGLDRGHVRAVLQTLEPVSSRKEAPPDRRDVSRPVDSDAAPSATIAGINDLFLQELGLNAHIELTRRRTERPMAYLRINPHAEADRTNPAAEQTDAFRGWLLTIKARLILDELEGMRRA